ncbi:Zn-dependent exopeptidase [Delitschia confertaspora ATCC 74209]|uniref:Zn-dependent exopeptidase n=1 Tax=Delitschia confertaspora ATCC 74209 TaxID=1513339 RepID=A0A9P4JJQ9_9PLEO|nr:Zn-dependent exopeptidase [Delitschia confertaspora ATCC 74209]
MVSDEKHHYNAHLDAPIPTYEEATSSRPSSSQSRLGPHEVSDDAERQGLLDRDSSGSSSQRHNGNYHAPSVRSARSSEDSDSLHFGSESDNDEDAALRQEMEEMYVQDPESAENGHTRRDRLRGRLSKRFYSITNSFSGFHMPKIPWPSFGFGWLTSRLPSIPEQYKPGWAIIARLCGLILIISLVYWLIVSEIMPVGGGADGFGQPYNLERVRLFAQDSVDGSAIEDNLRYITSYDHVAGTEGSFFLAQWIENKFQESHMDLSSHEEFYAYLNYPKPGKEGRRVAIVDPPALQWEAKLDEESVYDSSRQQTAAFHGLSASGNVTGPLIYANYGSKEDFKRLSDDRIDVKGAIVLVRYYGTQTDRAMKVKAAQDAGAAGVLIYSDPADDGFKKGEPWPKGRWMPEDGVQRGSVALTGYVVGDVLTPGLASTRDAPRLSKSDSSGLVKIPSLPLAWRDAQRLLQALKGHGKEVSNEWVGGVPGVEKWWSGDAQSPKVNLMNVLDEVEKQRIYNAFGTFLGIEESAQKIIVGNHRDSWCFGAADPGSGTAVMVEVARVLGELRATGWRPLRTIEFASWDAEEYNMIGSTEHVEDNIDELRANALAYINVDVGVSGENLYANGSPIFERAWLRVLDRIDDPLRNKTLRELWDDSNGRIGGLGAGSDYVAFQDLAGCSSIDFGFAGPENGYPMHSCYETFDWMSKYGDPGFVYHKMLAEIWVLLILELAQEPIVPLNLESYAESLQYQIKELHDWLGKDGRKFDEEAFKQLVAASQLFATRAKEFHAWEDWWYSQVYGSDSVRTSSLTTKRIDHNARIMKFETHLLDLPISKKDKSPHGLPGREQYKHIIFAPDASGSGYDASIFPFVRDAAEAGDTELTNAQLLKTAQILNSASDQLFH